MTKVISQSVKNELASILAETNPDFVVTGKILNKGLQSDAKLSEFLLQHKTKQFKLRGMGILTDSAKRSRIFEQITGNAGAGFTSIKEKQAQVIALCDAEIDPLVVRKQLDVTNDGTSKLDKTQQDALAAALVAYREFLIKQVKPQIEEIALTLGVMETTLAAVPAPAELVVV